MISNACLREPTLSTRQPHLGLFTTPRATTPPCQLTRRDPILPFTLLYHTAALQIHSANIGNSNCRLLACRTRLCDSGLGPMQKLSLKFSMIAAEDSHSQACVCKICQKISNLAGRAALARFCRSLLWTARLPARAPQVPFFQKFLFSIYNSPDRTLPSHA